jgi:membrane associated rhomboid family serine protease
VPPRSERRRYGCGVKTQELELTPSGGSIRLEADGILYGPRDERSSFTRYSDVTHFGTGRFGLSLGTRKGLVMLRRSRFRSPDGPEQLAAELRRRIAGEPGGLVQLSRMVEIEKLEKNPPRKWATSAVVALCVVVGALQVSDHFVTPVGALVPELVLQGEYWRLFTANFLHAMGGVPLHLVFNMLAILVLSLFVERPLGPLRTAVVIVASGVAAMAAAMLAGYESVVGASGIASGLAGAALCLELHSSERLPVWWRIPRRLLIGVILVDGAIGFAVPAIAGWAHFGGFVAGYGTTRILEGASAGPSVRLPAVKLAAAVAGGLLALSFLSAGLLVTRDGGALSRHAWDLLETEVEIYRFNDVAWIMATESNATQQQLEPAVQLAERAVEATDRENPDLLDTLAEVLFQVGELDAAIDVIDEAISITQGEEYFREQRRRFTGERDADDRPDPPAEGWVFRRREQPLATRNPEIEI